MARENGQRTCFKLGQTPGSSRIVLFDDMEGVLKWEMGPHGFLAWLGKSQVDVFNGDYALRWVGGSTLPDGIRFYYTWRSVIGCVCKRLRLELLYSTSAFPVGFSYGLEFVVWIGGVQNRVALRKMTWPTPWYFFGVRDVWVALSGSQQDMRAQGWHRFAVEFDLGMKEYVAFESDGMRIEMNGIRYGGSGYEGPRVNEGVRLGSYTLSGNLVLYFDDVLVRSLIERS